MRVRVSGLGLGGRWVQMMEFQCAHEAWMELLATLFKGKKQFRAWHVDNYWAMH